MRQSPESFPRSAIVTGAASGLGRAIALRLARDRWRLSLVDLDVEGGQATLAHVIALGGSGRVDRIDVSRAEDWAALHDQLRQAWPHLDLLVNNAGVSGAGEVGQFQLDDWAWILGTNLQGAIYGCHTFVDWLKANPRGGHILNMASAAAFISGPTMGAYNVAKAGVVALSETLYVELAPANVGVTVVCPGFVSTQLLENGRFYEPFQREFAADCMRRTRLTPERVAEAAVSGMLHKQLYVIPGRKARHLWRIKRLFPAFLCKMIAKSYRRQLASNSQAEAQACVGDPDAVH